MAVPTQHRTLHYCCVIGIIPNWLAHTGKSSYKLLLQHNNQTISYNMWVQPIISTGRNWDLKKLLFSYIHTHAPRLLPASPDEKETSEVLVGNKVLQALFHPIIYFITCILYLFTYYSAHSGVDPTLILLLH